MPDPYPEPEPVIRTVIAFTTRETGTFQIYIIDKDGSNKKQLTFGEDDLSSPKISPDSTKILYHSLGDYGIYIMDTDGSDQIRIATGMYPCWFPDGTKIAFGHNGDIYTINIDGTEERRITNHNSPDYYPSVSPDGNRIAYIYYDELHVINIDGTGSVQLTDYPDKDYHCYHPAWSPLGDKIIYKLDYFNGYNFQDYIYIINPDGTNNIPLTEVGKYYRPCWSPDGSKIAYEFRPNSHSADAIWVMDADGTNKVYLTSSDDYCTDPSWGVIIEK